MSLTTHQKRSGFTLIELLVVIAIIALLAAILFPVFGRARENARRTTCQSNLKQIGLGITQYSQDYDELLPGAYPGGYAWQQKILPYTKSIQIYACPSAKDNSSDYIAAVNEPYYSDKSIKNNYIANGNNGAQGTGFTFLRPMDSRSPTSPYPFLARPLAQIVSPTQCILVHEYEGNDTSAHRYSLSELSFTGHLGMTNFLFADGHVKAMKPSATNTLDASVTPRTGANMWSVDMLSNNTPLKDELKKWDAKLD